MDELSDWLTESDFFTAPASTQFHGCYPGGLAEHSLNVYRELHRLIPLYYTQEEQTPELYESAAIAALFHDLCKVHFYEPYQRNVKNENTGKWEQKQSYRVSERVSLGHSQKSVIILQQFMRLKLKEIEAIFAHMGFIDSAYVGGDKSISKIFGKNKLALLTHFADMAASNLRESTLPPEDRNQKEE